MITIGDENAEGHEDHRYTGSNQFDQTLTSISVSQYAHLANKLTEGKPLQYFLEKSPSGVTVNLWPVPDSRNTYTLVFYYLDFWTM